MFKLVGLEPAGETELELLVPGTCLALRQAQGLRSLRRIEHGEILDGELPPKAARLVRQWALDHRKALMANWVRGEMLLPMEMIPGADADDQACRDRAGRRRRAGAALQRRLARLLVGCGADRRDTELTRPLAGADYFRRAFIEGGTLAWPNGLELSGPSLQRRRAEAGALVRVAA